MSLVLAALLLTSDIDRIDAPMSSGELTDICSANSDASAKACVLYLRGAFEAVLLTEAALNDGSPLFCLPHAVTLADIRDNFVEETENDPSLRDVEAGITLLASLETTYPCDADDEDTPTTLTAAGRTDQFAAKAPAGVTLHIAHNGFSRSPARP